MKKRKVIIYGDEFNKFYHRQTDKIKERINRTVRLIQDLDNVPVKFLKKLSGTDLFEIRVQSGNNIFRILCFFDTGNLVVLLNAFQKKSQLLPKQELDRARKLQKQYYEDKGNKHF